MLVPSFPKPVLKNFRHPSKLLRVSLKVEIGVLRLVEDNRTGPSSAKNDEAVGTVIPVFGKILGPLVAFLPLRQRPAKLLHSPFGTCPISSWRPNAYGPTTDKLLQRCERFLLELLCDRLSLADHPAQPSRTCRDPFLPGNDFERIAGSRSLKGIHQTTLLVGKSGVRKELLDQCNSVCGFFCIVHRPPHNRNFFIIYTRLGINGELIERPPSFHCVNFEYAGRLYEGKIDCCHTYLSCSATRFL